MIRAAPAFEEAVKENVDAHQRHDLRQAGAGCVKRTRGISQSLACPDPLGSSCHSRPRELGSSEAGGSGEVKRKVYQRSLSVHQCSPVISPKTRRTSTVSSGGCGKSSQRFFHHHHEGGGSVSNDSSKSFSLEAKETSGVDEDEEESDSVFLPARANVIGAAENIG